MFNPFYAAGLFIFPQKHFQELWKETSGMKSVNIHDYGNSRSAERPAFACS